MMDISPKEIIDFWFSDRVKKHWFSSTLQLDKEILETYATIFEQAASGQLNAWTKDPEGCLALVIVLDQFPLNMYRGQAKSFSTERKAVETTLLAIKQGFDKKIDKNRLAFLYMSLMHSEDLAEQAMSVELYHASNLTENAKFAEHHRDIIRQFGRFPHRNRILGRESTAKEVAYLASANAFKG